MRTAPLLVLALLLVAGGARRARADDFDIARLADLEALVQRVEQDGLKRFTFEKVRPKPPEASIVFKAQNNTVEQEKEFRRAWIQAYSAIGKGLQEEAKPAQKEKKQPWAKDALGLLAAATPRIAEVKALEKQPAEAQVFAARDAEVKKFLKRYDFGPKIARASALGTAVINVNLAPDTFELVKRHIYSWKFAPLKGADGKEVKAGSLRVEYTEQLSQNELREALSKLANEYFAVRYAKGLEREVDLVRVTGARLLLGTYYFIEHEDRLIVAREPGAGAR